MYIITLEMEWKWIQWYLLNLDIARIYKFQLVLRESFNRIIIFLL